MTGVQKLRSAGLGMTALGAIAWIIALEGAIRTMDDGNGANIGAGLLLLAGRGLAATGLVVTALSVVIAVARREGLADA